MTLLLVMNLDFAWGAQAAEQVFAGSAQRGTGSRRQYRYGYRYIVGGVTWLTSLLGF